MKKFVIMVSVIIAVIAVFFAQHQINSFLKKGDCLNVKDRLTTVAKLASNDAMAQYITTYNLSNFESIIYSSQIKGIDSIYDISLLYDYGFIYEYNLSLGEYWVQKVASPVHPVLFYYRLYTYNDKLFILVTYSIQSVKKQQTQDYHALYEYIDVSPQDITDIIP